MNVNGAFNFFRLKNDNKDIYLFFNDDQNFSEQSKCNIENDLNIDIDNLFGKFLYNNKDMQIDFLVNIDKNYTKYNNLLNGEYLKNIRTLFVELKNMNYKLLKLHYINFSGLTPLYTYLNQFDTDASIFLNKHNIYLFIDSLYIVNNYIVNLYNFMHNNKNTLDGEIVKILNKILDEKFYNDKKIHKILNEQFKIYFTDKLEYFINNNKRLIEKFLPYEKKINNFYNNNTFINYNKKKNEGLKDVERRVFYNLPLSTNETVEIYNDMLVHTKILFDLCNFLDAFVCLRRILDKNYITNVITYANYIQSSFIFYILVKYFNFKIEEYDFINDISKEKLIEEINKKDFYDITQYLNKYNKSDCIKINSLFK